MYLKGVITLTKGLLCKQEVLGKRYQGTISNINVVISFPSPSIKDDKDTMNLVGMSNPLKAPSNGENMKHHDEPVFWGYHMNFPNMDSFVKSVLIETRLSEGQTPQDLYDNISRWENALTSYCELCSKQHFERKNTNQNGSGVLELISEHGYVQNNTPFRINGIMHSSSQFVSEQQISDAIKFASSNMELLLEYQMLLSAYESKKQNHNRQAIIDACSAAEIVLIKLIQDFCATKGIDSEILISKYRSLGERFDLVKKLDNSFPNIDYKNDIVKYRNDVAHNRNVYPSNGQTDTLISAVEQLLSHYHKNYYKKKKMTKQEFLSYCLSTYGTSPDYPFDEDFETAVLRHKDNRKWYAIVMRVSRRKFGFESDEVIDVVNLKIPTEMFGSFGAADGVYPAYHMNKLHWISMLLPDAPDDVARFLVNVSFEATKGKKTRAKAQ